MVEGTVITMTLKGENSRKNVLDFEKIAADNRFPSEHLDRIDELQDFYDSAPVGYVTLDSSGRLMTANSSATVMLKMIKSNLIGQSFRNRVVQEDWDIFHLHLKRLFEQKKPQTCLLRLRNADGEMIHITLASGYKKDRLGRCVCRSVITDITEQIRTEERFDKENREIELVNRVLRVFIETSGDDLFDRVLTIIQESLASRHGVFGYISEPGHLICPSLSKMLDSCAVAGKCIQYPPDKWKGLWGRALKEKRSLYTNDPPRVPAGHPPIHNNLVSPILYRNEVIGLLNLANKESGYTEADCLLLETMAERMAPMLYAWIQKKLREDERAKAEEDLRQSQKDLARAQAVGQVGSWRLDVLRNILTWSDENHRIFGAPKGTQLTYQTFLGIVHPDDRQYVDTRWKAGLRGEPYDIEHRIIVAGKVRWVREKAFLEFDEKGKLLGGFGITQDITDRKKSDKELRRLSHFPEENPNPVLRCTLDGTMLYANTSARDWLATFGGRADGPLPSPVHAAVVGVRGKKQAKETEITNPDGRTFSIFSVQPPGEDYINLYGIDLTDRKRAEETLAASREELNSIMRNVPDVIFRLDPDGCFTYVSSAITNYGYQPEELIGTPAIEIVYPEDREKALFRINERRTGARSTKACEIRLLAKNWTSLPYRFFNISAEGLYYSNRPKAETFIGTQGIASDVTDRIQAQNELLQREKMQAVLQTAGAVCHEMNQPLMAALGYTELALLNLSKDTPFFKRIINIRDQIERMGNITKKLLGLTQYHVKNYGNTGQIIDIDKSSTVCE